jgi:hypothetical protein
MTADCETPKSLYNQVGSTEVALTDAIEKRTKPAFRKSTFCGKTQAICENTKIAK